MAVEHVQISGVAGPEAAKIDAALGSEARRMSTLDVHTGPLLAAVAPFRVVRELHATPSFPHGLRISVIEQPPVAALTVGTWRTAVAADGVVLGPALLRGSLPTLEGTAQPLAGARLGDPTLLAALRILGAAPAPLRRLATRAYEGPMGLTIAMHSGLLIYFGDGTRPHAKWLSLEPVLADPSSAGASYVDVRLPQRPAAGFPPGVAPSSDSGTSGELIGSEQAADEHANLSEESTVAALAAGLSAAGGVEASAPAASPEPQASSSQPESSGDASPTEPDDAATPTSSGESAVQSQSESTE